MGALRLDNDHWRAAPVSAASFTGCSAGYLMVFKMKEIGEESIGNLEK
jgi:hypothetical protein